MKTTMAKLMGDIYGIGILLMGVGGTIFQIYNQGVCLLALAPIIAGAILASVFFYIATNEK